MNRALIPAALACLIIAGTAWPQEGEKAPVEKGQAEKGPAVVELFEDNTTFLIDNLTNPGAPDGSLAERNEETVFAGAASLTVSEFQRFHPQLPGWRYKIAENPKPGEYRYLRFAWKRTEAPGIMLQLHTASNAWHRYYAGTLSKQTQSWGAMMRVDESMPREWKEVTRDLFMDIGSITITGLGLSALEGEGHAYFDHIYLGRTVEDLDRITAALKAVADPPIQPAPSLGEDNRWMLRWAAIAGIAAALLLVAFFAWRRTTSKAGTEPEAKVAAPHMLGFTCAGCGKQLKVKDAMAGRRVKCPGCGEAVVAPS